MLANANPKSAIQNPKSIRVRLTAGRLALNQQIEVRILDPKPFRSQISDFRFQIVDLVRTGGASDRFLSIQHRANAAATTYR